MTCSPRVSGTDSIEAMKRRWSMPADPQEARIGRHVRDHHRRARRRDAARHALADRDVGAADLVAIEPVGGRQGQARLVAVQQVERRDARSERVAGAVDDRVEELVPRPGGRRQSRDMVEEAETLELLRGRRRIEVAGRHRGHDTRVRRRDPDRGCGTVAARARNGDAGARPQPQQNLNIRREYTASGRNRRPAGARPARSWLPSSSWNEQADWTRGPPAVRSS